ncbi:alpha/beta hydrolase [Frondihabitans cladoniiphilus]
MSVSHLSLLATPTLVISYIVAGIFAVLLVIKPRKRKTWWRHVIIAAILGSAIGGTVIWYVGDVQNAFDVPPTWVDRIWTGVLVAGICVGVVNLIGTTWIRRVIAAFGIVAIALASGLAINNDVGEYLTVGQLLGTDTTASLVLPRPAHTGVTGVDSDLYATWKAPAIMAKRGRVGSVTIPGTLSHFSARKALVYLPPAALVANAPALPVVILLSGQPASPSSVMTSGHVPEIMNAMAKKNHGLAPIVVVPDQLGASSNNPMCVDGPLGNSATYITRDVPDWILGHLHVQKGAKAWAIGGFSQGATCSIQFAAAHPTLFGSFIDVSGQKYPTLGSDAQAIQEGFGGSTAAFDAAKPEAIMKANAPYEDTVAFFAAGQNDAVYSRNTDVMTALASQAGMHVTRYVSPGSAHDWTTATNGFSHGLGFLYPRLGLSKSVVSE